MKMPTVSFCKHHGRLTWLLLVLSFLTWACPLTSVAQTPPDAGQLLQQIERDRERKPPSAPVTPEPRDAPEAVPDTGVTIEVSRYNFVGNTLLDDDYLQSVVADYVDVPVDFARLQSVTDVIAQAYQREGWLVRAFIPPQDIEDGVVTIQILEAQFGALQIEGQSQRVQAETLQQIVDRQQQQGKPINRQRVDRAILLIDDIPGLESTGVLATGDQEGQTDLVIAVSDGPVWMGDAGVDNGGSRSTGAERLTFNGTLLNPRGYGEILSASLMATEGSQYGRLAASMPFGVNGLRAGVSGSYLTYELVGSDFEALDSSGISATTGVDVNYPVHRARMSNLYLRFNLDHKRFDNESLGATTTRYTINSATAMIDGNVFDDYFGGGANTGSLGLVSGQRNDSVGAPDQRFNKLFFAFSRQQILPADFSVMATLSGQFSDEDALDSSERFYLGGSAGVRAYPSSEAGGVDGWLSSLTLRRSFAGGFSTSVFYDHGRVQNRDDSPSYALKGAGLSIGWFSMKGINLNAVWAHRIGDNPNPTPNGDDQDGSLIKNRVWLSANMWF